MEAAEAMSRSAELQEQSSEDPAYFILKKEHDYVSPHSKVVSNGPEESESQKHRSYLSEISVQSGRTSENSEDTEVENADVMEILNDWPADEKQYEGKSDVCSMMEEQIIEQSDITNIVDIGSESVSSSGEEMINDSAEYGENFESESDDKSLSAMYKCDQCNYSSSVKYYLQSHKLNKHSLSYMKCGQCEKVFANLRYLKRHESVHEENSFTCDLCGKRYKCNQNFKAHLKTHKKDYVKEMFPCDSCKKSYTTSNSLERHKKLEHQGVKKNFLCQTCGKSFTSKYTMQQHLNVHTGQRPYVCNICGKDFTYKWALSDHKRIHEKTKSYVCDFPSCNKAFIQRSALQIHKRIHKATKDFVCDECGRGFTQKQALERHVQSHKGLKPFQCVYCSRAFGDPSVIRRHIQLVHKVNKDVDKWREDMIELTPEECEASMKAAAEKASDLQNRPVVLSNHPHPVVQMISQSRTTALPHIAPSPGLGTLAADSLMESVNRGVPKQLNTNSVLVQSGVLQYQFSMPNFETAFLIRPSATEPLQKTEISQSVSYDNNEPLPVAVTNQDQDHMQFFGENLDGTFTSVADTSHKGKTLQTFLQPSSSPEAGITTEQSLEQLKPDGTLAETSIALQEEDVVERELGDSQFSTESLNQFYSYYNSLTNQPTVLESPSVKT